MSDSQTGHLWAEEGQARLVPVANVVLCLPVDKVYAYALPEELHDRVRPGQRVRVPVGRRGRPVEGFVLELGQRPWTTTLRPIAGLVDECSWLDDTLLGLGRWMSEYYAAPLGRTLECMVPSAVQRGSGFESRARVRLAQSLDAVLGRATRIGPRQRRLLECLPRDRTEVDARQVRAEAGVSAATLRSAVQRGWVLQRLVRGPRPAPDFDEPLIQPDFELNADQRRACTALEGILRAGHFEVALLHGVSGSGKTEVYIHAMARVLAGGRQVILLVPEIALTTQLVHRFASRFRDVAVLHSGLTDAQRSLTWHAIREGRKRVVVGTRSAVFAPCRSLGLIVIDEEQDTSYKNQPAPRFHARDVAICRARLEGLPVVLGSATPALETWHNSRHKPHYRCLTLTRRVAGLGLPTVELVDMRDDLAAREGRHLLSRLLEVRLAETLQDGGQVVLFLNQRGYASALLCPRCRTRVQCPRCRASLVVHRAAAQLHCHHCHLRMAVPSTCPDSSCGGRLLQFGIGTERVEEEVRLKFPRARVARVDSDTMDHVREYERVLGDFAQRRLDIMIGTQIVAKGLDFPGVSLVGVVSADTALFQPDFRANERTFQLVTQVAGRAGRATSGGRAVVQTLMSDLPALQAAVKHDYEAFAEQELSSRRQFGFPPFTRLLRWILQDPLLSRLEAEAAGFAHSVRAAVDRAGVPGADVLGPHPSPIERIRGQYRYDVVLRTLDAAGRAAALARLRERGKPAVAVQRLTVDVDPISLL